LLLVLVQSANVDFRCSMSDSECWTLVNQLVFIWFYWMDSFYLFFHLINYSNRKIRVVEEVCWYCDQLINHTLSVMLWLFSLLHWWLFIRFILLNNFIIEDGIVNSSFVCCSWFDLFCGISQGTELGGHT